MLAKKKCCTQTNSKNSTTTKNTQRRRKMYWCHYPQSPRDSVSPVCEIFLSYYPFNFLHRNLFFSIVGASSWVSPAGYFLTVGASGFSRPLFCDGRSYQVSPVITFVTVRAVGPGCVSPAEPVLGGLDRTEHKPG